MDYFINGMLFGLGAVFGVAITLFITIAVVATATRHPRWKDRTRHRYDYGPQEYVLCQHGVNARTCLRCKIGV